jgi:splicing factor 3B subunit 4
MAVNLLEKNEEAILFVTNLDMKVSEEILWELFTQTGPVVSVFMPKDKITSDHQGYAFVEFKTEVDADYTLKILQGIKLYNRPAKLSKATNQRKIHDIGANIFVGNLDPSVDERKIFDSFSAFGPIVNCKLMRDPISGISKGFAFISYDSFEASDKAIQTLNGQYYSNKVISVDYAYKKDTKGERHGTAAERLLAANRPVSLQTGIFYGKNDVNYTQESNLVVPNSLQKNSLKGEQMPQNFVANKSLMKDISETHLKNQGFNFPPLPKILKNNNIN